MPRENAAAEENGIKPDTSLPADLSKGSRIRDHLSAALFESYIKLKACYIETIAFGIAFGQLAAVTTTFYNEIIFQAPPGTAAGLKWAAYSALLGRGVGFIIDSLIPVIAFSNSNNERKRGIDILWVGGSFLGCGIFVSLFFITNKNPALVLLGSTALVSSTHNLFSLLAAGSLVEPKYRATSFGVRAACLQIGLLIGSVAGEFIAQGKHGIQSVMLLSACTSFLAGIAAACLGSVEKPQFTGVATDANPLIKFALKVN